MKVTIHFVNGQKLTVDRTLDEVSRVLGGFEQAEATIPMQGGMTLFFNPADVTHVVAAG